MKFDHNAASALCEAVAQRLEHNNPDLTAHVRSKLPSYENISEAEHRRTLQEFTRQILTGIAQGQGPVAENLQFTRRAARRRAQLGVSAYDVLRSFHIGNRTLWEALKNAPEATDEVLLDLVEPLALWTESMTATVVDAFVDESPISSAWEAQVRQRFFAELGDQGRREHLAETARLLAFDVDGIFQAVCSPRSSWPDAEVESLQRSTRRLPGVVACGVRGTVLLILVQDTEVDAVVRSAQAISGKSASYGIGLRRTGLDGAQMSSVDAERALRAAEMWESPVERFHEAWLEASLLDSHDQLAPIFEKVQRAKRSHPDLAAAVMTFAETGFSLARAAKELQMHPNSVAYRLTRWQELTGADPRTFAGLVCSVIGTRIAPAEGAPRQE